MKQKKRKCIPVAEGNTHECVNQLPRITELSNQGKMALLYVHRLLPAQQNGFMVHIWKITPPYFASCHVFAVDWGATEM